MQSQSTSTGGSGSFENAPVNENLDSAVSVENQTERKIELNKETEKAPFNRLATMTNVVC